MNDDELEITKITDEKGRCHYCGTDLGPAVHGNRISCPPGSKCWLRIRRARNRKATIDSDNRFIEEFGLEAFRARRNGDKWLRRSGVHVTRRTALAAIPAAFFGAYLDIWPGSKNAQEEVSFNKVLEMRRDFVAGRVALAANKALAILNLPDINKRSNPYLEQIRAHALTLLRDAGYTSDGKVLLSPEFQKNHLSQQISESQEIDLIWRGIPDFLNLSVSRLTCSRLQHNLLKLDKGSIYAPVLRELNAIENILKGRCVKDDQRFVKTVRLWVLIDKLKVIAFSERQLEAARPLLKEIRKLATEIGTLQALIVALQCEIGFYATLSELDPLEIENAEDAFMEALPYFATVDSPIVQLGLCRQDVEFYIAQRDEKNAQAAINRYISLWRKNPVLYHRDQLEALRKRLEEDQRKGYGPGHDIHLVFDFGTPDYEPFSTGLHVGLYMEKGFMEKI